MDAERGDVMDRGVFAALAVIVAIIAGIVGYYIGGAGSKTTTTTITVTGATGGTASTTTITKTETVTATPQEKAHKITVYVYSDFMAWGEDPKLFDKLVKDFERVTGISVEIRKFDDARTMVTTAISEYKKGVKTADVIIGVDSLLIVELKKNNMLECYVSPNADEALVEALDPDRCVTPIDYGLIALVYDPSRLSSEELAMLKDGVSLDELVKLAPRIVTEDPTKSSPGLNFLLYTIALSEKAGRNWEELWSAMKKNNILVLGSWSDAFNEFLRTGSKRAIVVSYGTDPAYSAWENMRHGKPMEPSINATVLTLGGKKYGWVQVEGVAIIKGADVEAAKKFVDWLLSIEVQSLIPENQWMLPARPDVPLPAFYKYALTEKDVDELANTLVPPSKVSENLEKWLAAWLKIMSG